MSDPPFDELAYIRKENIISVDFPESRGRETHVVKAPPNCIFTKVVSCSFGPEPNPDTERILTEIFVGKNSGEVYPARCIFGIGTPGVRNRLVMKLQYEHEFCTEIRHAYESNRFFLEKADRILKICNVENFGLDEDGQEQRRKHLSEITDFSKIRGLNWKYDRPARAIVGQLIVARNNFLSNLIKLVAPMWFIKYRNDNWHEFKTVVRSTFRELLCMDEIIVWYITRDSEILHKHLINFWERYHSRMERVYIPSFHYSKKIHCRLVEFSYDPTSFNESYLRNLVKLGDKRSEQCVDEITLEFMISKISLNISLTQCDLWIQTREIRKSIDMLSNDLKLKEESLEIITRENVILREKVDRQDRLIAELSTRLDLFMTIFDKIRERAPREIVLDLIGTVG